MQLGNWLAEQILLEQSEIKTVVAIYPGRFQPMGKHHAQTYRALTSKFDTVWVATSGKVSLPKSPFSFAEKKKIINSHGISNVKQVKNPYQAKEILSKYDPKTTAAVFVVGKKDASRLGGKFFRPWKGKAEVGYNDGAYTYIAPHVSLSVPGYGEMSGTAIRKALGDTSLEKKDKVKLFKGIFGHTKNYDLIVKKLEKLNEIVESFIGSFNIGKLISEASITSNNNSDVDDGPRYFYGYQKAYRESTADIAKSLGMSVLNYLVGEEEFFQHDTVYPKGPTGAVSYFPTGIPGQKTGTNVYKDSVGKAAYKKYVKHITNVAQQVGYKFIDFVSLQKFIDDSPDEPKVVTKFDLTENINLPIEVGDTVMMGKFKNKKVVVKDISWNDKGDLLINGRPALKIRIPKKSNIFNEGLILEGGAYGHMSHPFDDKGLTFGDFKKIIELGLQGNIDLEQSATEKTDGQNLFISWTNKLVAARNTGDIKSGGKDSRAIAKKFAGRGNIEKAFNYAMRDLSKAIGGLSDKQKKKIFDDGNNWVNMEIMYPASSNVINYDAPYLQFHNVLKYKNGSAVGAVHDGARILAGMVKQVNQNVQKSFSVIGPKILKVKPHQDFGAKKSYFTGKLNKLMSKYNMSNSNTFGEYHQAWWEDYIEKNLGTVDNTIKIGLVKRWAFFDKSFRLNSKTIPDKSVLEKAIEIDKQKHINQVKKNMFPFETLFFELGAEVLKNVEGFLAANPEKAVQNVRRQVAKAIGDVRKGGDLKKLNRLTQQLEKIKAIGGFKTIIPSEGLVFIYKGKTYKLTGSFGPVNQITGLMSF